MVSVVPETTEAREESKYKVSVGKYLIWAASTLLGYGIFNLMIIKHHVDMKDEHSELEDFYGNSEIGFIWGPTAMIISLVLSLLIMSLILLCYNKGCARFSSCRCANPDRNEVCEIF